jgi:hypothetical protein
MHKKLSRERPFYKPTRIACDHEVIQVTCCSGVIWAVTIDRLLLVRLGVQPNCEEGTSWAYVDGFVINCFFSFKLY